MLTQTGQAGYAGQNQIIETHANSHDMLALAPYFGDLTQHDTLENSYGPLYAFPVQQRTQGVFKDTQGYIGGLNHTTKLSIYEINFHYTSTGGAGPDIRNPWMTGVSGIVELLL
jgi:hypothetical protein